MTQNPFDAFLQFGENVHEMAESYSTLVARNSPTPLYLSLPAHEQQQAQQIANRSVVRTYTDAIAFGLDAQESVKTFSNLIFSQMKKADSDKINRILFSLVEQLQQIDPDRLKPASGGLLKRLFQKQSSSSLQQTISNYKRLSKQVDRLAIELTYAQSNLQQEHEKLQSIYVRNKEHFMRLNVFIAALELKLQQLRDVTLPQLRAETAVRDDLFADMSVRDLEQAIEWLERRMYDLQVSREITLQAAPQIRMMQATNQLLIEKIQGSVLATIPMWQTQIATILTLGHQTRLQQTQHRIDELSEQMLHTNVASVQQLSKEEQIEELKETQSSLVETILDVVHTKLDEQEQKPKKTRRYQGD